MNTDLQVARAKITGRKARNEFWSQRREQKSAREKQIKDLIAEGRSNNEISALVGVSPKTVSRRRNS